MAISQSPSESKYWSMWQLSPYIPSYYRQLFKYAKSLFKGLYHDELNEELDKKIKAIEWRIGRPIAYVYWVYENLPSLNSYTKSQNIQYHEQHIYKHTMKTWFEHIEDWVFQQLVQLEPQIRFSQQKPMQ